MGLWCGEIRAGLRPLLPNPPPCSSFLLTLAAEAGDSGSVLTLRYWPATTDTSKAAAVAGIADTVSDCCDCVPSSSALGAMYWRPAARLPAALMLPPPMLPPPSLTLQSCAGKVTVTGGQVDGVPTTPDSSCPAGSYDSSAAVDGCRAW